MIMKRIPYILCLSALCLLFAPGCTRSERPREEAVVQTLYAGAPGMRVQLNETLQSVWNTGDRVSVFFLDAPEDNECWDYTGSDKAASGTLTYTGVYHFAPEKVALYPYDAGASLSAGVIDTSLPAVQPYVEGSYGTALLAARSNDGNLHFQYATALVQLSLTGVGRIAGMSLVGNNGEILAGAVHIDVSGASPVLSMDPGATATSLSLSGPSVLERLDEEDPVSFFFSVPPGTYSKGFTATVSLANGDTVPIRYTSPITLEAGDCALVEQYVREEFVVDVQFAEDPQTSSSALYSLPTATKMVSSGTVDAVKSYNFNTPYTFQVWAKMGFCKDTSGGGARIVNLNLSPTTEKDGVTYGGTGYAWIKLPAISGKKLLAVRLDMYAAAASGATLNISSAVDASGVGNADQCPATTFAKITELKLASPSVNTPYYLCTGNQTGTRFVAMHLVYSFE